MDLLREREDLRDPEIIHTWKLILTKKEIKLAVKTCANIITTKFRGKDVVIVCILKGAVYFFVDLTRQLTIPHSCYFIEASSYHNSQQQSNILSIMGSIEPSKFVNKHVILVDELYDNGHTMEQIKRAINEKASVPMEKIFTCVLFKKNKTTTTTKPDLYGINTPNVWLVGYGLDDKQEKRGWTNLFACPKCANVPETDDDIIFKDQSAYDQMRKTILKFIESEQITL